VYNLKSYILQKLLLDERVRECLR